MMDLYSLNTVADMSNQAWNINIMEYIPGVMKRLQIWFMFCITEQDGGRCFRQRI